MKKFLSAFLAVLMVLSMVATSMVTVFAADAEEVHSILVANGEDLAENQSSGNGWRNHKINLTIEEVAGQKAAVCKVVGPKALTDVRFHYGSATTVDTTKWTHVEFDLYVADASKLPEGYILNVELSSAGVQDKDEAAKTINDAGLQSGWNHIKLALADVNEATGNFNATAWNFVRVFFSGGNFALGENEELVLAIDNFGFSDGTEAPAEAPADPVHEIALPTADTTVFGWEVIPEKWNMCFDTKTPDGSNAYLLRTYAANETLAANMFNMFWWDEAGVKSFNAAEADTFAMDMWLSDTAAIANTTVRFEIGSGSMNGLGAGTYIHYDVKLGDLVEGGLKANAWNTFKISLDAMTKNNGEVDWTKIDWFRLWNIENATTGADGLKVGIDNVRFVKGEEVVAVMSTCEPSTNGWSASFVEIKDAIFFGKTTAADKFAICDIYWDYTFEKGVDLSAMKYIEYDLYVSDVEAIKDVTLYMEMTSSGIYDQQESGRNVKIGDMGLKNGWNHVKFELAKLAATAGGATMDFKNFNYFRLYTIDEANLTAAVTVALDNVRVTDETEPVCADCNVIHAIDLPKPGTTVAGWGWAANFALNDTVSVSNSYAANTLVKFCDIYVEYKPTTPVDASKADALTFDFYVSDVTGIENATLEIEIASVQCDNQELNATGKVGALVEGGLKAGWNTVVMPFDKLIEVGGAIDLTNIKWFRIYNQPAANGGEFTTGENGLTIAVDNLRFTKEGKAVATLSDVNPDMMGWGAGTPLFAMGEGIVMGKTVNGKFDVCDVYYEYVAAEAFDITEMKYLEFDFYLSNAKALKNVNWTIELTSAGASDKNEIGTTKSFNDFVNGWNHIKIDLSTLADTADAGACDKTAVNFFRMFTIDVVEGIGELTFALTNVRITDGEAIALPTPEAPELPDTPDDPVEPPVVDENTKTDLYEFQIDNGEKEAPYLDPDYKANWNGSLRFADAAQYFIYKYTLTNFRGIQSITFSGNFGGQYHIWASADGKAWVEIAKRAETSPAQSLTLDLTVLAEEIAKTRTVYVKIGDSDTSNGNGGNMNGNVQLAVVYDKNADQTWTEPDVVNKHEKDVFELNSAEEEAHLVAMTGKWNGTKRYADGNAIFTYKYTIKNVHQVVSVIWKGATNQELKLDISFDNENWENVFSTTENLAPVLREYDLTKFLVKDGTIENATFYLRISDADPSDGWGGGLLNSNPVTLDVEYTPLTVEQMDALEATKTEHCIPLWGANKTWGDLYETDNENQTAGSGCISINLKGVTGTHAPSKKFDSVDATGMDTFEFEIYLSDLAIIDHLKNNIGSGSVELCSGGACDQGEKSVSLAQIFTDFMVGEAQVGWNHIAIPLDRMASTPGNYGAFEINNINYIRIFWSGMTNPVDKDMILKLDNFRMTDAIKQAADAEAAYIEKVLKDTEALRADIDALKNIAEITAENVTSAKAKLGNVKAAFAALEEKAQTVLTSKGYKKTMNDFQKLIDAYDEAVAELEAHADLIAELEALAAYKEAASITAENVDTVKAAIAAAQAKVDALDDDAKALLADYIANIAAAQASVDAYVPAPPKKSCGGVLTVGAVATMVLAGAWVAIAARKKED